MARNPETYPTNPLNPPDRPDVVRILLGPSASKALTESGEKVFALVSRGTYPHDPSRWVILLRPCSLRTAQDAEAVAMGEMVATKPRKAATPATTPPTANPPPA